MQGTACNATDQGSIPGSGGLPGAGNGNPHQSQSSSCSLRYPGSQDTVLQCLSQSSLHFFHATRTLEWTPSAQAQRYMPERQTRVRHGSPHEQTRPHCVRARATACPTAAKRPHEGVTKQTRGKQNKWRTESASKRGRQTNNKNNNNKNPNPQIKKPTFFLPVSYSFIKHRFMLQKKNLKHVTLVCCKKWKQF